MNGQDILLDLLKYFAAFVPKEVLKKTFVKKKGAPAGYDMLRSEIMALPDDKVIPDIDNFIFSANESFLSQKIKNSEKVVLYIEYGAFSYAPNQKDGIKEKLAIHIGYPYNDSNNDNLSESLIMNMTHNILCAMLDQMECDQKHIDFCPSKKLIVFPAEIVAIDPKTFYDRTGWMAVFDNSQTNIL